MIEIGFDQRDQFDMFATSMSQIDTRGLQKKK
jgi:hypothetical protein